MINNNRNNNNMGGNNNENYDDELNQAKESLKLLKLKMNNGGSSTGIGNNQFASGKKPIGVQKGIGNNNIDKIDVNVNNPSSNGNYRKPFKPNLGNNNNTKNNFDEEDNFPGNKKTFGNNNKMPKKNSFSNNFDEEESSGFPANKMNNNNNNMGMEPNRNKIGSRTNSNVGLNPKMNQMKTNPVNNAKESNIQRPSTRTVK